MLDDGNVGGKQQCVRGPLAAGGVVDVERVDTDQCCVMVGEPGCARPGQEVPALGVGASLLRYGVICGAGSPG